MLYSDGEPLQQRSCNRKEDGRRKWERLLPRYSFAIAFWNVQEIRTEEENRMDSLSKVSCSHLLSVTRFFFSLYSCLYTYIIISILQYRCPDCGQQWRQRSTADDGTHFRWQTSVQYHVLSALLHIRLLVSQSLLELSFKRMFSYSRMVSKFTTCLKFYMGQEKAILFNDNVHKGDKLDALLKCIDQMCNYIKPVEEQNP